MAEDVTAETDLKELLSSLGAGNGSGAGVENDLSLGRVGHSYANEE
jgi:hypothetical protein